ncbi:MAG: TIGR02996 domain-containing protein [Myxococcaceae bacterium]
MKQRPARQSFNLGGAQSLQVDANGDVVVFAHDKVVVHRWATGKTEKYRWSAEHPQWTSAAALLGNESIAAATYDSVLGQPQFAIFSRKPFEARRVLAVPDPQVRANEITASADGRHFAIARDHGNRSTLVDVFTADGEHVQSIRQVTPLIGVTFAEGDQELLVFTTTAIHRFPLGSRRSSGFVGCELPNWGAMTSITRSQGELLLSWRPYGALRPAFLFDEAKLRLTRSFQPAHVYSWGPAANTLVRSTGPDVELIDTREKRLGGFRRDRATALQAGAPHPSGFWAAAGGFLELYDFARLTDVVASAPPADKKRAAPKGPKALSATPEELAQADELLAKIFADPDDEQALRVYADWLCEHGGETRGQYIQLSLLRDATDEQRKRAKTLLKRHRGEWLGAARPYIRSWLDSDLVPGFPELVTCEAAKLIEGFEQVARAGPRLMLSVTAIGKQRRETEKKLAALPFHRFDVVILSMNGLDDRSLTTLAPALKGVRSLWLQHNPFTGKGLAQVAEHGGPFEELQLSVDHRHGPETPAEYVKVLTTAPSMATLKRLHFEGMQHSRPAALLVELRAKLKHLEVLSP